MTCDVEVLDQTAGAHPTDAVAGLVRAVLEEERAHGSLTVALVDEDTIARLNAGYRDVSGPTDVLSFPEAASDAEWVDPSACPQLGEIAVCPAVVARYAEEDGVPLEWQLGWTLIHGTLHILGYDHETDQGQMRAREQELLRRHASRLGALISEQGH